ncbi:MAG TPA: hypothetical protein VHG28_19320 [Longimicrobiaceae bacterium]|nr:hypothetical protein [Longimicrobiaceae bacterium]
MREAITVDEAIEDYLHGVVRVRPWTKKREEELLHAFCDWMYATPGVDPQLAAVSPELAARYAAEAGLEATEAEALLAALRSLSLWACAQGVVEASPFA